MECHVWRPPQVCQVSAQQPVQTELLMRYHQLQSRLATLKIENEEVRIYDAALCLASKHLQPNPPHTHRKYNKKASLVSPSASRRATSPSVLIAISLQ